jgi:ABC-2 type transport system ATP-binding protein
MKRRLMIARALIHHPRLLILDEPTAGVDIELRRGMWDFLQELTKEKGITIILTTHYLEEAEQLCKNVAIINKGQIVEQGSMVEVLSRLDKETFIFYLKNSLEQSALESLQKYHPKLVDEKTLEASLQTGQILSDLMRELGNHQIEVVSMRNKSNRLEEVFMNFTS